MAREQKTSAGLLMFRRLAGRPTEVLLAHPGGPFWARKDLGAWTIPKGGYTDEAPLGFAPTGPFIELATIRQNSGKLVAAWAGQQHLRDGMAEGVGPQVRVSGDRTSRVVHDRGSATANPASTGTAPRARVRNNDMLLT